MKQNTSVKKSNYKPIIGIILGSILVLSLIVGIVTSYQSKNDLKLLMRSCLLFFSIIYTYGNFIRYRRSKQSVQG